jgi:peptidoglycan/xylan/chitin deacetylase (PgdA/CDA1 family)
MMTSLDRARRWAGARWWRVSGRAEKNRHLLYGGATGLRIVTFHGTPPRELPELSRIVGWCRERFGLATPADADALFEGRWRTAPVDRVLFTFDDGLASNHEAAQVLWEAGVSATFFVVPSLVDRTIGEFVRFHDRFQVKAYPPVRDENVRGLSSTQLREIVAMGHRVAAHNFAHRDLGNLHSASDLRYEITNALDRVAELTGAPCLDFAIGFGQPWNVSEQATAYLLEHCPRVYACHRGLNVPGKTPRFLLRHAHLPQHPFAFTCACLEGAGDHRAAAGVQEMTLRGGPLPRSSPPSRPAYPWRAAERARAGAD